MEIRITFMKLCAFCELLPNLMMHFARNAAPFETFPAAENLFRSRVNLERSQLPISRKTTPASTPIKQWERSRFGMKSGVQSAGWQVQGHFNSRRESSEVRIRRNWAEERRRRWRISSRLGNRDINIFLDEILQDCRAGSDLVSQICELEIVDFKQVYQINWPDIPLKIFLASEYMFF